jgi:hypothetical protein
LQSFDLFFAFLSRSPANPLSAQSEKAVSAMCLPSTLPRAASSEIDAYSISERPSAAPAVRWESLMAECLA